MAYTEKQLSTIEYLINRGKMIHKRLESPIFEDKKKLEEDLQAVKRDLKTVLNAEAMFKEHIKIAEEHIAMAEALRDKWIVN